MTSDAVATRRDVLDVRVAELRRDLQRLEAARRTRSATDAAGDPRIVRTYHRVLFGASVRVRRELRDAIRALPYVKSVHEDRPITPFLNGSVSHINADKVWTRSGTRGAGVTVAVIDTGIDYRHPALGGGFGSGFKVFGGWDFYGGDDDPLDEQGHGTHVAGIIAGNGGGILGVAPDASLLAYRVIGPQGGIESDMIAAIERTVDPDENGDPSDRVDVVNMSIGGPVMDDDPAALAVENATAAGVLFCIAAGNSGNFGYANLPTPAIAASAITVGASDDADDMASFSTRGPSYSYGIKPEVVAPGVNILSSYLDGKTVEASGTSMATPHIAGVAALMKAVHRDWSPAQIKAAIVSSSVPLDEEVMAAGAGRVDALNATSATMLVTPVTVDFGRMDVRPEVWSASRTVTLRNLSAQPQTLTATVHGSRAGVVVRVIPEAVTIAPGGSAAVAIDLAVTNGALPELEWGSFSFGGRVDWTGGESSIHVPWAFVQGAFLTVDVPDAVNDAYASILGTKWQTETDFFYGQVRTYWPIETVDVVVNEFGSISRGTTDRIVVAERVDLAESQRVSVPMEPAQFVITTDTTDEKGGPLNIAERSCKDELVLAFAQGRKISFSQTPDRITRFGPFSDRVRFYVANHCADIVRDTVYASVHAPLTGLRANVTSTLRPQWLRQEVKFASGLEGHMTEALPHLRFRGTGNDYFLDGGWHYLMRPTSSRLNIFYAPSPVPETDLMMSIGRWGSCYEPSLGHDVECPFFMDMFLYLDDRGVRADGDIFMDISPMAYRAPAGAAMTFGTAPVWPQLGFAAGPSFWAVFPNWRGPLGETRALDPPRGRTIVRDAAGTVLADAIGPFFRSELLPRGAYQIESTNSHYTVAGIAGTATVKVSLDTTRNDPLYPLFTGLRIVDGQERQTDILQRGAPASLLFSIADAAPATGPIWRIPPREEATRVEYRVRGTSDWKPLTPLVQARQYQNGIGLRGGVGTMYRVDLSSLTRDVQGAVDLRFHAEDTEGNTVDLVLEPALFVGNVRRRAVGR